MGRWRTIPWKVLFAIAALAILSISLFDLVLRFLAEELDLFKTLFGTLQSPNWFLIRTLIVGFGMGLLAFGILENRTTPAQIRIDLATLWAFILCLGIALWIRSLIPIYGIFITGLNYPSFVGVLCGVFWQSRRYWRY